MCPRACGLGQRVYGLGLKCMWLGYLHVDPTRILFGLPGTGSQTQPIYPQIPTSSHRQLWKVIGCEIFG